MSTAARDGQLASQGKVLPDVLTALEALEFYHQPPPKSLGVEWVDSHVWPILDVSASSAFFTDSGDCMLFLYCGVLQVNKSVSTLPSLGFFFGILEFVSALVRSVRKPRCRSFFLECCRNDSFLTVRYDRIRYASLVHTL